MHEHVGREIQMGILEVCGDPSRQLITLVVPLIPFVRKNLQEHIFSGSAASTLLYMRDLPYNQDNMWTKACEHSKTTWTDLQGVSRAYSPVWLC